MQTTEQPQTNAPHNGKLSYSIKEFAKLNGLARGTVYSEINAGRLKTIKVGRRRLIPVEAAKEWLSHAE